MALAYVGVRSHSRSVKAILRTFEDPIPAVGRFPIELELVHRFKPSNLWSQSLRWGLVLFAVGCGSTPSRESVVAPPARTQVEATAEESAPVESAPERTDAEVECLDACRERSRACADEAGSANDDGERRGMLRRCGCASEACENACLDSSDWSMPLR